MSHDMSLGILIGIALGLQLASITMVVMFYRYGKAARREIRRSLTDYAERELVATVERKVMDKYVKDYGEDAARERPVRERSK